MFEHANEIPIHYIWIGKPMPKMICKCLISLIDKYKDNPIYFWTEQSVFMNFYKLAEHSMKMKFYAHNEELDNALRSSNVQVCDIHMFDTHRIFTKCTSPKAINSARNLDPNARLMIKADAYRLAILEEFGGVYFDADFYHLKNICSEFIKYSSALGQNEPRRTHGNALIYVNKPRHMYIESILDWVVAQPDFVFNRPCYIGPRAVYKARNRLPKEEFEKQWSVPYEDYFVHSWEEMENQCYEAYMTNTKPVIHYRKNMSGVHLWYDYLEEWAQGTGSETEFEFVEITE